MSLRTGLRSNSQVVVVLRENQRDSRGRLQPVEIGRITVFGRLQQSSVEDINSYSAAGERGVLNMKRFYCRSFPGDDLSHVIDDEGIAYEVVGEPKRHRGSVRTARDVVMLRQISVKRGLHDG